MIIDWFTFIAQALNFLILVWLLKRFLYKPILDAIDAREKRIALALAETEAKKAEALQEKNEFQYKNEEFDRKRATLLIKAVEEAKAEGRRLRNKAQLAADAYSIKRQEALQREQQSLNEDIIRRTRKEVFAIARKTLIDLADATLEERMSDVLKRRLRELSDEKKKSLARVLKTSPAPALIHSAFLLTAEQQGGLEKALKETISPGISVRFETAPELISGIELIAGGHKIAWCISDYLESLERSMARLMGEQTRPESGRSPASPKEDK